MRPEFSGINTDPRELARQSWVQASNAGQELSRLGASISTLGASLSDQAALGIQAIDAGSENANWESVAASAQIMNSAFEAHMFELKTVAMVAVSALTTAANNATLQSYIVVSPDFYRADNGWGAENIEKAAKVRQSYSDYLNKANKRQRALELLRLLGLESTTAGSLAMAKFETAWQVHEQKPDAPDPALRPLMSLREAL